MHILTYCKICNQHRVSSELVNAHIQYTVTHHVEVERSCEEKQFGTYADVRRGCFNRNVQGLQETGTSYILCLMARGPHLGCNLGGLITRNLSGVNSACPASNEAGQ